MMSRESRRNFLRMSPLACTAALALDARGALPAVPPAAFQGEKSGLKITGIQIVQARPRTPLPASFRYTIVHELPGRRTTLPKPR